jgi:hypothetical protein
MHRTSALRLKLSAFEIGAPKSGHRGEAGMRRHWDGQLPVGCAVHPDFFAIHGLVRRGPQFRLQAGLRVLRRSRLHILYPRQEEGRVGLSDPRKRETPNAT